MANVRNNLTGALYFAGETPYPAFLSKQWFQHENASALRKHIRNLILQLFIEQKRLPVDHQSIINAVADMADYQENKSEPKYALVLQCSAAAWAAVLGIKCNYGVLVMRRGSSAPQLGK